MDRVWLTVEEVADALCLGRCKIFDLLRSGELESVKVGRLRRIPVDAVHDFARRLREDAAA